MYYVPSSLLNPQLHIQLHHLVVIVFCLYIAILLLFYFLCVHLTLYEQKQRKLFKKTPS